MPAPSLIGTKRKADDEAESSPNIEKRLRRHTPPREAVQPRRAQIPINAAFFTAQDGEPFDGQLDSKKQGRKEAGATKNKAQGESTIRRGEDEDENDLMDEDEDEDNRVDGVQDTRRCGEVTSMKGKAKAKARDDEALGEEDDDDDDDEEEEEEKARRDVGNERSQKPGPDRRSSEDEDIRANGVQATRRGEEVSILKSKDKGKGRARDDEVTGEGDEEARAGVNDERGCGSGFNQRSSEEVNEAIQFVRHSMAPASKSSRHGMQVGIYPCVRHFASVCLT